VFPPAQDQESIDMYQYRMGFEKAFQIGQITRAMKEYAIDCNLNRDAVMITGLPPIDLVDSQGLNREDYPINDVPFTAMCDWIEDCEYMCGTPVEINPMETDDSTYDESAARWRANQVKQRLRKLFELQPSYSFDRLIFNLTDIPRVAISAILGDIVGNRSFRIQVRGETGYIVYKNGYYLFQPERLSDLQIPIALRAALFPVKQDSYEEFEDIRPARPAPAPAALPGAVAVDVDVEAPAKTEGEVPLVEPRGDVVAFWAVVQTFVENIESGTLADARSDKKILPESLENALRNRYKGNKKAEDKAYNTFSMIYRFYQEIKTNGDWRVTLAYATAKLVWDEMLTIDEQYSLYQAKQADASPLLSIVWNDHLVPFEDQVLYRRLNPATGTIEYKCDGENCSPALVAAVEAEDESTDEVRMLRANATTTGKPYGTINFKNGLFVFKTNLPVKPSADPKVHEKKERGSECAIVPNMPPHYALLEEIGRLTKEPLGSDFGFRIALLEGKGGVKNSIRACALTDIALRFLDELRFNDKRWFYRPLETFYTKHIGILRKKAA
jgi:hypothetical protein